MYSDKTIVLSKMPSLGTIVKTPDGTIHVSCCFATLRFHERQFVDFTLMVKAAFSALAEESLEELLDSSEPLNPSTDPPCCTVINGCIFPNITG